MNGPLLLALHGRYMEGLKPLQTWAFRAQQKFPTLKISNVYTLKTSIAGKDWLSELVAVVSIPAPMELELMQQTVKKLGDGLELETTILMWGPTIHLDPQLTLPHPELHLKEVFLQCASEVEPDMIHPILGQSLRDRLNELSGQGRLEFFAQGRHVLPSIVPPA